MTRGIEVRAEWYVQGERRRLVEDPTRGFEVQREQLCRQGSWSPSLPTVHDLAALIGPPRGSAPDVTSPILEANAFELFWKAYPTGHKIKKPDAMKAWKQTAADRPNLDAVLSALERWKGSDKWLRGYVEHPATWLRAHQWADTPPPPASGKISAPAPTVHRTENATNLSKRMTK